MAVNMLRITSRRAISTSCQRSSGITVYADRLDYPAPPCRFVTEADLTSDMQALKTKEGGDWKELSLDEKVACEYTTTPDPVQSFLKRGLR